MWARWHVGPKNYSAGPRWSNVVEVVVVVLVVVEVVLVVVLAAAEAAAATTVVVVLLEVVVTVLEANSNIRTCGSIGSKVTFRPCVRNKGEDVALKPLPVKRRMELRKKQMSTPFGMDSRFGKDSRSKDNSFHCIVAHIICDDQLLI